MGGDSIFGNLYEAQKEILIKEEKYPTKNPEFAVHLSLLPQDIALARMKKLSERERLVTDFLAFTEPHMRSSTNFCRNFHSQQTKQLSWQQVVSPSEALKSTPLNPPKGSWSIQGPEANKDHLYVPKYLTRERERERPTSQWGRPWEALIKKHKPLGTRTRERMMSPKREWFRHSICSLRHYRSSSWRPRR